jgi:hypothetical protein
MKEDRGRLGDAIERLKAVFLEKPTSQLTAADAACLSGVDIAMCEQVLQAMKDAHFLREKSGGRFERRNSDESIRGRG